jgi:hypothetical protein
MDQLIEALSIQAKENFEHGTHRLIGEILVDLEWITHAQVDEVLFTMSNRIVCLLGIGR